MVLERVPPNALHCIALQQSAACRLDPAVVV
jgi:hypothetical protein